VKVYGGWRYVKLEDKGSMNGQVQFPATSGGWASGACLNYIQKLLIRDEGKNHLSLSGMKLCSTVIQPVT
jgi:hypothetical protein